MVSVSPTTCGRNDIVGQNAVKPQAKTCNRHNSMSNFDGL